MCLLCYLCKRVTALSEAINDEFELGSKTVFPYQSKRIEGIKIGLNFNMDFIVLFREKCVLDFHTLLQLSKLSQGECSFVYASGRYKYKRYAFKKLQLSTLYFEFHTFLNVLCTIVIVMSIIFLQRTFHQYKLDGGKFDSMNDGALVLVGVFFSKSCRVL